MRTIILAITFLSSFCCFSQVAEDFSDGDFTQNPSWTGDTDKFVVDSKKQLRLDVNSGQGEYAGLYTRSSLIRDTEWKFFIHLLFNPSANNYGLFFLANSESGLTNSSNGYVVKIGGEKDEISLCRMDKGKFEPIIQGRELMKGNDSPQLNIRIECNKEGKWSMWSKLQNEESEYTNEGTQTDTCYSETSFIGVGCIFTPSRSKAFIFDEISVTGITTPSEKPDRPEEPDDPVTPDPEDHTPPRILSLIAKTDTIINIEFSEAVTIGKTIFSIDSGQKIKTKRQSESNRKLDLILSTKLENNHEYTLTINGIRDLSGNLMPSGSIRFKYYDVSMQTAGFADVVFNELMANPKGTTSFPESEYIELYNRTGLPINLKGWKLVYGNKSYLLSEKTVDPQGYTVLCAQKYTEAWNESGVDAVGMTSFPTLSNSGKLIYLEDSRNKLISWIDYSDSWYRDDFKKQGGYSLECIDPDNLSGSADNWKASDAKKGGTPGISNSVKSILPDVTHAEISHSYMNSPDTLVIIFTKPMDLRTLSDTNNFQPDNIEYSFLHATPEYPEGKSVALTLSKNIQEELTINVSGLKDISGYDLEGNLTLKINQPEQIEPGDLVFNEIMFNPLPGENDYIELYNTSDKYLILGNLRFTSQTTDGSLSEAIPLATGKRVFAPHSYLCFTKAPASLNCRYSICKNQLVKINSLPSLPDDKGNILLTTENGEILDKLAYTEKMHSTLLNDKEGIALEKMHPEQNSQTPSNWLSASTASGGGTPGCINSQYREFQDKPDKICWLENESFSPDGDGKNEEMIIRYRTTGENDQANINIFDATGHLVNTLAKEFRLGTEGFLAWNGKNKNEQLAPPGIYIIHLEIYDPNGNIKRFKLACALTK